MAYPSKPERVSHYLVCFVVVLGIVLKHLRPFLVVECSDQVISAEFFPPLLIFDEPVWVSISNAFDFAYQNEGRLDCNAHLLAVFNVKLSSSEES